VATKSDAQQNYALYLPRAYTADRKWPVLYALGPDAKGAEAVGAFQAAAERHGWIVAGSNNARDGTQEVIQRSALAMIKDVEARLAVDSARRYLAGLGGAGRFIFMTSGVAGLIPCGSGFPPFGAKPPEKGSKLAVFSLAAAGDMEGCAESLRLEEQLRALELRQRLTIFEGEYGWPPPEHATAAVRYMELLWLTDSGQAGGKSAAELVEAEKADAAKLMAAKGRFLAGYERLEELARMMKGTAAEQGLLESIAAAERGSTGRNSPCSMPCFTMSATASCISTMWGRTCFLNRFITVLSWWMFSIESSAIDRQSTRLNSSHDV
jgi:hypothetical protein